MISGSELWLLRLMADRGRTLLAATSVHVVLPEGRELRVISGSSGPTPRTSLLPGSGSAVGELHEAGRRVVLFRPSGPEAAWLRELGLEAEAALVEPLPADIQPGLVFALRAEPAPFAEADVDALHSFAQSLTQRLAAERSVELERLRHGLEARERERTRWAREIHDETIQGLGGMRLRLANARDEDDARALRKAVDEALEDLGAQIDGLRHLITELRPAALDDLGLIPALEALGRRATAMDDLEVTTELEGAESRYDAELESVIYRVVQEAITNVGKHAEATAVTVRLRQVDGHLRVSVADNGRGLGPAREGGFGLAGMRERAELVGAELDVSPGDRGGTVVSLSVPVAARQPR